MEKINIYTDGSCRGNPGPGGWGAILLIDGKEILLSEQVTYTTNQKMELMGAIKALDYAQKNLDCEFKKVVIYTDSAYLFRCWKEKWWKKWIYNGWINSSKEPVANKELWVSLIPWFKNEEFSIVKVKGHQDNKYNNMADLLATGKLLPTKE